MHYNQSGRSMTEMLGVLAIMGIITYGAISGINYGMTSYNVNKFYIEIGEIINDIQDMYTTVYGRNSFPTFECDTENTPCSSDCKALTKNGILSGAKENENCANTKGLKIKIEDNELEVTLQTKNKALCDRLKDMDWDSQSITHSDTCTAPSYELTFTPK